MTLTSSIPVLRVADYPRARAFWIQTMGFSQGEEGGDPPRFGMFHRGGATVYVDAWHGADDPPSPGWRAYMHTGDVDALAQELAERGYDGAEGPRDTVYGMRELVVTDPDGNRVCFGQDRT